MTLLFDDIKFMLSMGKCLMILPDYYNVSDVGRPVSHGSVSDILKTNSQFWAPVLYAGQSIKLFIVYIETII